MADENTAGFWGGVGRFANNNLNPIQQFRNLRDNPAGEIIKGLGNSVFPGVGNLAANFYNRNRQNSFNREADASTDLRTQLLTEAINQMPITGRFADQAAEYGFGGTSTSSGGPSYGGYTPMRWSSPSTNSPLMQTLGIPNYLAQNLAPPGGGLPGITSPNTYGTSQGGSSGNVGGGSGGKSPGGTYGGGSRGRGSLATGSGARWAFLEKIGAVKTRAMSDT